MVKSKINSLPFQDWISNEAIKLKINPKHLEIHKSPLNGWYVTVKYSYGREEKLNNLIRKEQIRRQLKGLTAKQKDEVITSVLRASKLLNKIDKKIKII